MFTVKEIQLRQLRGFSVHTEKKKAPLCLWFVAVMHKQTNTMLYHIESVSTPAPCIHVCCIRVFARVVGAGGTEGVAAADWSCPHTQTCSSWQIKMNSVVFGSGSPFIIFHFAQRASRTSAAACHVKTLYQALTAPPMHARTHTRQHTARMANTHTPLVLKPPPTDSPTYVGNICSDLSH